MHVIIDPRFRGPVGSGNGGYTCGVVAGHVAETATVTLRIPPPLDRPLRFEGDSLWDGEVLVAQGHPAELDLDVPPRVAFADALLAAAPDLDSPFPECFVCGHARTDGLRIFAGPVEGRDVVAAPWVPTADVVGPEFVWAALDCPGAYATGVPGRGTVVLGRLTVRVERVPHAGEHCVVVGWSLGHDGRKHDAGTALYGEDGDILGVGRATWIEPR